MAVCCHLFHNLKSGGLEENVSTVSLRKINAIGKLCHWWRKLCQFCSRANWIISLCRIINLRFCTLSRTTSFSTHLPLTSPHSCLMHASTHNKKNPSHPTHVATSCVSACRGPLSPFRPPASTSTFHLTVSCDRPAMWDSRYCPSLLLTHFPPFHPSSSTLLLIPFSWPHLPPPLHPTQRMTSHPLYGLTEGSFI